MEQALKNHDWILMEMLQKVLKLATPRSVWSAVKRVSLSSLRWVFQHLPIPDSGRERLKHFSFHLINTCLWRAKKLPLLILSVYGSRRVNRLLPSASFLGYTTIALQVESLDKGGVEEVVFTLAKNLQRFPSLKVIVFVVGHIVGHLGEVARKHGIPVINLSRNPFLLRRLINKYGVRVVNFHYTTFGTEQYTRARVPIVYTIHNTYIWADAHFIRERSEQYKHVSQFIAVSGPVRDFFASRFSVDASKIRIIPNGLDLDHVAESDFVSRAELGLGDEDVVFVNVASYNWNKFHILMVAAMERLVRRVPKARLLFVGNAHDPACRPYIEDEILRRGLTSCITILNYAPKKKLLGLMKQANCFVLPSLIEGWSIAVMEAMYCELPLILSDVGSARSVIEDGDIGIIIRNPYHDLQSLTPAMVSSRYANDLHLDNLDDLVEGMATIGLNREEWKRRAKVGRKKILDTYNATEMCREYVSCFERLISKEIASCS
jgi:O-antigen biosynthesis protein